MLDLGEPQQTFYLLGVSLAIGLLIGIERGWKERDAEEGSRIAGVRTYGLIGLFGGAASLLAGQLGVLAFVAAFAMLTALILASYVIHQQRSGDAGITSMVAALMTFLFGGLAVAGKVTEAAAFAVVTSLLLGAKPALHRWIGGLESKELRAGLKLLLISVVLLPILPNQGYGPWNALNPYEIWWMVVLIASISFVGYFAMKLAGAGKGAVFTGLFAGLASSTALTLHFSRVARGSPEMAPMLAAGILLACGTMFPRMVFVASVLDRDLLKPLLAPATVMGLIVYGAALFFVWRIRGEKQSAETPMSNPLELTSAISFGALLAGVMLLGEGLKKWFGDAGILALSAVSGVADVDAITLSLARMSQDDLATSLAVLGIVVAAAMNSVIKGGMALAIGGVSLGTRVFTPLLVAALAGLGVAWLL